MNAIKLIFITLALFPLIAGCAVEESPEVPVVPVIEGWIDSDGYPVVMFTASIIPDEAGVPLADKMLRWAKVTISDGENTVVMTGGPSDKYFPPFRYYTFDIKGKPGATYRIVADYKDLHAEAICTMPQPTEIKSIDIEPIENNDTLRAATLRFDAPTDCPAYYCVTIKNPEEQGRALPAMFGTVEVTMPGQEVSVPLLHPASDLNDKNFVPQLIVGESLQVSLNRVTPEVYRFWREYDNIVLFGGSLFVSADNGLKGNIAGGYGVWSAQGVSSRTVEVK